MLFIFSTPMLVAHLWQLMTVVLLHWCLRLAVLLLPSPQTTNITELKCQFGTKTLLPKHSLDHTQMISQLILLLYRRSK